MSKQKMIDQIKINPEYEKLVPKLSDQEFSDLKQSIKENGQWVAIIVNQDEVVLDGHHRYKACMYLGLEPRIIHKSFTDKLEEEIFVIECNLKRRHLNTPQKFELCEYLEPRYAERAKKKLKSTIPTKGKKGFQPVLLPNESSINRNQRTATAQAAKAGGLSRTTYERLREIKKTAPDVYENVKSGRTSVAHAYTLLNTEKRHNKMTDLPNGKFNIILADPPWKYDVFLRGTPERHYDVMELDKLKELKIPSAEDCVLFLWVTNPKVPDALELLNAWGFEYKTNFVWVKDKIGTGYYCRSQHELLFIAKKGNPPVPKEADRANSVIESKRNGHSEKPALVYDIIEKMYPNGKYLELFARRNRQDWKSWGNHIGLN